MKPLKTIFLGLLFLIAANLSAQNFYIYPEQALEFGDFIVAGTGGTVTVTNSGMRSSSGTIQLLNSEYYPAIFTISTDNPAPINIIVEVSREALINSEGTTMMMASVSTIADTYTIQIGKPVQIKIGGTIQVNSGVFSPGEFQGNISITVSPNSE